MFPACSAQRAAIPAGLSPLAWHPDNKNAVIMGDLAGDMTPLLTLSAEQLRERLYTRRDDLAPDLPAVPIKLVHINKCPVLAPANTLRPEDAERLGIDRQACLQNLQLLKQHPEGARESGGAVCRSRAVQSRLRTSTPSCTTVSSAMPIAPAMKIIQQTKPQNLPALDMTFER